MKLTRRNFLKVGGSAALAAGAGATLAGCGLFGGTGAGSGKNTGDGGATEGFVVGSGAVEWADAADVLIIGTGISGLAAAIPPTLAGKKVTLVEKLATFGGESIMSCGFMFFFGSDYQIANGIDATIDKTWEASAERLTTSKLYTEKWYGEWVKKRFYGSTTFMNLATKEFGATWQKPAAPEVTNLNTSMVLPEKGIGNPLSVLEPVKNGLAEKGARFLFETKALALIKDAAGTIIGLRCQDLRTGENLDIRAEKICIATGGFSCNQVMVARYLPQFAGIGNLTVNSTGDGQLMGFAAGAKPYGMENPAYLMGDIAQATTWGYFTPLMLVLPNGKRFISEGQSHDSGERAEASGFGEWWVIFDENAFKVDQIKASVEQNIATNPSRYVKADSIEKLAAGMSIDAATLAETLKRRNEMAAKGEDLDFQNTRHFVPLQAPFHALRLMTRRYKTYGGFLTTLESEVIGIDNNPIPNLYACGSAVPWSTSDLSPNAGTGIMAGDSMLKALS